MKRYYCTKKQVLYRIIIILGIQRRWKDRKFRRGDSPRSSPLSIENGPNKRLPRVCPSNALQTNADRCQPQWRISFLSLLYRVCNTSYGTVSRVLYRVWCMPAAPHRGDEMRGEERRGISIILVKNAYHNPSVWSKTHMKLVLVIFVVVVVVIGR